MVTRTAAIATALETRSGHNQNHGRGTAAAVIAGSTKTFNNPESAEGLCGSGCDGGATIGEDIPVT